MEIIRTELEDCFIIKPSIFEDSRGYFMETYNSASFSYKTGVETEFVQDNQSFSTYGVIRGLHAQAGEHAQSKLVRVLEGEVLDVAIDVRPGSKTFGQHAAVRLSGANKLQFFVPKGFLHGFAVLSKRATFFYKCDNYYNKESEFGVVYNDPNLNIDWKIPEKDRTLSEKRFKSSIF